MMAAFNTFVSGEALVGTKFSTGLQCSDVSASGKDVIVALSAECCSDGKGICDSDTLPGLNTGDALSNAIQLSAVTVSLMLSVYAVLAF